MKCIHCKHAFENWDYLMGYWVACDLTGEDVDQPCIDYDPKWYMRMFPWRSRLALDILKRKINAMPEE